MFPAIALAIALALAPSPGRAAAADTPPGVPILMYHVIADPPPHAAFPQLYVSPADFRAQMSWLARHGYHAVTLTALYGYWFARRPLPSRPIVVSFDDGYRSQAVTAAPVLRRHGWPGVIDLEVRNTTDFWGLPPGQVRRLLAQGWELVSHTRTHPDLTTLDATRLRAEVSGSRAALQRMFHVPVDFFCYPSGRYDATVQAAVRAAGYLGATTTDYGLATPATMTALKRIRIDRSDGLVGFASKLERLQPRG